MEYVYYIIGGLIVYYFLRKLLDNMKRGKYYFQLTEKEFKEQSTRQQIIDVRTPVEFKSGHIKGARNIPLHELKSKTRLVMKDKPIFVYCQSGSRSRKAAAVLIDNGCTEVYDLKHGLNAWTGNLK